MTERAKLEVSEVVGAHVWRQSAVFISLKNTFDLLHDLQGAVLLEHALHFGPEYVPFGAGNTPNPLVGILNNGKSLHQGESGRLQVLDGVGQEAQMCLDEAEIRLDAVLVAEVLSLLDAPGLFRVESVNHRLDLVQVVGVEYSCLEPAP